MKRLLRPCIFIAVSAIAAQQALAQEAIDKPVELDAVFVEWDEATKDEEPGVALVQPQKLRFVAKYLEAPKTCNTQALQAILDTLGQAEFTKRVAVTHCIKLASASGRETTVWVQDVLVPGFNADAKPGAAVEFHADLLAYGVGSDRARNMPLMLVSRFEPR